MKSLEIQTHGNLSTLVFMSLGIREKETHFKKIRSKDKSKRNTSKKNKKVHHINNKGIFPPAKKSCRLITFLMHFFKKS